jgi:hypothetical protein
MKRELLIAVPAGILFAIGVWAWLTVLLLFVPGPTQ